jgi:hypothetical protein
MSCWDGDTEANYTEDTENITLVASQTRLGDSDIYLPYCIIMDSVEFPPSHAPECQAQTLSLRDLVIALPTMPFTRSPSWKTSFAGRRDPRRTDIIYGVFPPEI